MNHWTAHFRFYDKFQMAYSKYRAMLDFHVNTQKRCPKVLDCGAGTGNLSQQLLAANHEIVAIDANPEALRVLKRKGKHHKERLICKKVDLNKEFPFEAESFDGVVTCFVLPFLESGEQHFSECYRVLKPGGTLSLSTPLSIDGVMNYVMNNLEKEARVAGLLPRFSGEWSKLWTTSRKNEKMVLEKNLRKQDIKKILKKVGFKVTESLRKPYGKYVLMLTATK